MSKPKTPNQKKRYNAHRSRVERYISLLSQVYNTLDLEVAKLITRTDYDGEKPFRFSDYPQTKATIEKVQQEFVSNIEAIIINGITAEWDASNFVQDELVKKVLLKYGVDPTNQKYKRYFSNNSDALKAFMSRKDRGLNLSQKVWDMSKSYKDGLEAAVSLGASKGTSAIQLSKQISQYLQDFPKLKKEYSSKFGKATKTSDCEYRSIRLARTEINMSYRAAEQTRWSQMDFVVGYEVKRSGKGYSCSVCESLAGKYPKGFKFVGWHPNCMCYVIPILKTEDEFWEWDGRSETTTNSVNEIKNIPDSFKQWLNDNQYRVDDARQKGTLPYFLKDNKSIVKNIEKENTIKKVEQKASSVGNEVQSLAERIASNNGGFVTPISYKSIASITRKVDIEGISPNDIKDAVRTTIIAPKHSVGNVINALSKEASFVRFKRQTPDMFMGYSGNIVNVKTSNGLIAEIQVNTERMIYAKENPEDAIRILGKKRCDEIRKQTGIEGGLGHRYYEEWRMLDKNSELAKQIEKKSINYYSKFN